MVHFRVYLRAELGKLRNQGAAQDFLASNPVADIGPIGIARSVQELTTQFADQACVDAFVGGLSDAALVELTSLCDTWRNNGVSKHLAPDQHTELINVPGENVLLRPAESGLRSRFAKLDWRLLAIAGDPVVMQTQPYAGEREGQSVQFATCLAEPDGKEYRLIDGMHRAIQLVRNGETQIHLCVIGRDVAA